MASSALLTHPDILSQILRYADKASIARCMQVSWSFFTLCSPFLYANITLIPDEADAIFRGASTGPMIYSDCTEREMKRELLRHVQIIGIREHGKCNGFAGNTACTRWRGIGIEFPHLKILRIWEPPSVYVGDWWSCPWIKSFNYDKLIMRDIRYLSAGGPYTFAPSELLGKPSKVVITIRGLNDLREVNKDVITPKPRRDYPSLQNDRVPPVRPDMETVIIFWAERPSQKWNEEGPPIGIDELYNLIEQLSICASVQTRKLVICNADKIPLLDKTPEDTKIFIENAMKETVQAISNGRNEQKQAKARLDVLHFMSFEEYLELEDWKGEFDKEEIEDWLKPKED
ncbi:uncharacterized protein IL334_005478 [Kwoniella shivajii]|uniref:F-box domain-containing protein n=1 Tax=Kwoniella shivajii TaxID=564305 RepID=A0ABZ1D787_9TREE|nr:hypothetical protein IL334_005478 [Kwoniella shivajii]